MTLFEHLEQMKKAKGGPTYFATMTEFVYFARGIAGDAFATAAEAAMLSDCNDSAFEVCDDYLKQFAYEALGDAFDKYVAIYGLDAAVLKVREQIIEFAVNATADRAHVEGDPDDIYNELDRNPTNQVPPSN